MDLNNLNPLQNIDHWEDDLIKRYPENKNENLKRIQRLSKLKRAETVREFYKLNHKYQSYDFVCEKENRFLQFKEREMSLWDAVSF